MPTTLVPVPATAPAAPLLPLPLPLLQQQHLQQDYVAARSTHIGLRTTLREETNFYSNIGG
ncbi:hypothetical protein CPC16_007208, partial [Podila verticillata]